MDKSEERRREFVVASSDASEVFEALEKPFDLITVFVELFVVLLRVNLVFSWRNASKSLPILNVRENFGRVITPVSKHANTFSDDIAQQLYGFR